MADIMAAIEGVDKVSEAAKKHATDIKNGVAFVPPPTEEKVEEVKDALARGISAMFEKKAKEEVPDFLSMFQTKLVENESVKENFIEAWRSPANQSLYGSSGRTSLINDGVVYTGEILNLDLDYIEAHSKLFKGYKVLNEAICRTTLITIMSSCAHKVTESSRQLLNKDEMCSRLDDLVHNYHMARSH